MAKVTLKDKKIEDLQKEMKANQEDLRKARFNVAGTKGLKSNAAALRKNIARIMTELKIRDAK